MKQRRDTDEIGLTTGPELIERHLGLFEERVRVVCRCLSFYRHYTQIISHLIAPDNCKIVSYVINSGNIVLNH